MPNNNGIVIQRTTSPRLHSRVKLEDLAPEDVEAAVVYLYNTVGLKHQEGYPSAEVYLRSTDAGRRREPGRLSVLAIGVNTPGQNYEIPGRYFTLADAPAHWYQEHIPITGGLQALKDYLGTGYNES